MSYPATESKNKINNVIAIDFSFGSKSKNKTKNKMAHSLYTSDGRIKPSAADPVKNKETIQEIKDYLFNNGRYGHRNYLIYTVGINIGRRAGDLLKLKIKDVVQTNENKIIYPLSIKTEVTHIEEKTGKRITFYLNGAIKEAISEYLYTLPEDKLVPNLPLFQSQKGSYLTARSYWKILNQVQQDLNLNLNLSTHTMRKTFGYHKYQEYKNKPITERNDIDVLDILQSSYGHNSKKQTLTYIGITKENRQKLYCDSSL